MKKLIVEKSMGFLVDADNQPCICPFATKLVIPQKPTIANPNSMGIGIQQQSCTSNCPLFSLDQFTHLNYTLYRAKISCGNKDVVFEAKFKKEDNECFFDNRSNC